MPTLVKGAASAGFEAQLKKVTKARLAKLGCDRGKITAQLMHARTAAHLDAHSGKSAEGCTLLCMLAHGHS